MALSPIETPPILRERIDADAVTVFRLVAEVELWPALFPRLRSARVLQQRGARRAIELRTGWLGPSGGWHALQTVDEAGGRISFDLRERPCRRGSVVWHVAPIDGTATACAVTISASGRSGAAWFLGQRLLLRVREIAVGGSLAGRA